MPSAMRLFRQGLLLAGALIGAGCDNGDAGSDPRQASGAQNAKVNAPSWLGVTDQIDPAVWLAQYAAQHGHPISAEDQAKLPDLLIRAEKRFGENKRMIANRAVQIEQLLIANPPRESCIQLIEASLTISGGRGRMVGFGGVGQQYVTLRKSGLLPEAALDELKRRYQL